MTYSGAATATQSRQMLGSVLETLQRDPNVPQDVLSVAENIAHAVGALFEAERASSDVDGKASVRHAMGSLSQTMALLQDLRNRHDGIEPATRTLAEVMSKLYPLAQAPTVRPRGSTQPVAARNPSIPTAPALPKDSAAAVAAAAPRFSAPPVTAPPPAAGAHSIPHAAAPAPAAPAPPVAVAPVAAPVVTQAAAAAPAPAPPPVVAVASPAAPPMPAPAAPVGPAATPPVERITMPGEREALEANVGATTESNFFVGFSGDIGEGGVFVATYVTLPIGAKVDLLVTLPGGFQQSIPGTVRFVRDPMDMDSEPGMGVRFDRLDAEGRDLILRFIRKRPPLFYDE